MANTRFFKQLYVYGFEFQVDIILLLAFLFMMPVNLSFLFTSKSYLSLTDFWPHVELDWKKIETEKKKKKTNYWKPVKLITVDLNKKYCKYILEFITFLSLRRQQHLWNPMRNSWYGSIFFLGTIQVIPKSFKNSFGSS